MKVRHISLVLSATLLSLSAAAVAQPVGTSFAYQGRLKESGLPANAPVDLQFALYDAATGGTSVTPQPICRDNVPVVDGLFTCSLDFGPVFTGTERYLQIGVRPAGAANDCSTGSYTPLSARQKVDGVPYAQWANLGPGGGSGDGCCDPRIDVSTLPSSATAKYVISAPGSYLLRGNITGESGKNGIEISASGVTLDLNGFALVGASGSLNGVYMPGFRTSVVIRNGHVRLWGESGVSARIDNGRIEHITADFNGGWGIDNNSASLTTLSSHIVSSDARQNGGLIAESGGIRGGKSSNIVDCVSQDNVGNGIEVEEGSTLSNCTSTDNGGNGITTLDGCTLSGCASRFNTGDGISTGKGCAVNGCATSSNSDDGVAVDAGTIVTGCAVIQNGGDGIDVINNSRVTNNVCSSNGFGGGDGAGIHANGNRNHIEGNNCMSADRGIHVEGIFNIIIRNTSTGNGTNWVINELNTVAPILLAGASSAPINGNSYSGSFSSTDPNANLTY